MNKVLKFLSIGVNTLGTQVLMFLGISLMAKSQGVAFVGYQSLIFSIASYLLMVVQLGFQTQGLKLLIEGYKFRDIFFEFTKVRFLIYIILLTFVVIFWFFDPSVYVKGVFIILIIGGISLVNSEFFLQYKERFLIIGLSRLLAGIVFFVACLYIYNLDKVAYGSVISILPYSLFLLVPQCFLLFSYKGGLSRDSGCEFSLNAKIVKQSSIIALGLLIVQLGYRADKIIISAFQDVYTLGLYDTAYKFLNVCLNLSFILYFVVAKSIRENSVSYYHKIIFVFSVCAIFLGGVIYLLAPYLIELFFGQSFSDSIRLLQLLIVPLCFMIVNIALVSPMNLFGMERNYLLLVSISTGINIISNLILVPILGSYGAVYSMFISELSMLLLFLGVFYKKMILKFNVVIR